MRIPTRVVWLGFLLALGPAGGPGASAEPTGNNTGELAGAVTRAPVCPAQPASGCAPQPAPGARIVIFGPDGQVVASSITDDRGGYRVRLPAGEYRVSVSTPTSTRQRTVTVRDGQQTRLDLRIDTGAR